MTVHEKGKQLVKCHSHEWCSCERATLQTKVAVKGVSTSERNLVRGAALSVHRTYACVNFV